MRLVRRASCPLCGSSDLVLLLDRAFTHPSVAQFLRRYYGERADPDELSPWRFRVARCSDCGLLFQTDIPDPQSISELYDSWVCEEESLNKKRHADISLVAGYARQLETAARLLRKPPHQLHVLDFGAGWGTFGLVAKAYGFQVAGVEISAARVRYASERGLRVFPNVREVDDTSLHFVNAEQVFEHLAEPLETLRSLSEKLHEGGLVRISVPDGNRMERRLKRTDWAAAHDALHPLEHINCFSHRTLVELAGRAGLVKITQPFMPGQGLMGKSFRRGLAPLLKSIIGQPLRQLFGTSLFFRRT